MIDLLYNVSQNYYKYDKYITINMVINNIFFLDIVIYTSELKYFRIFIDKLQNYIKNNYEYYLFETEIPFTKMDNDKIELELTEDGLKIKPYNYTYIDFFILIKEKEDLNKIIDCFEFSLNVLKEWKNEKSKYEQNH